MWIVQDHKNRLKIKNRKGEENMKKDFELELNTTMDEEFVENINGAASTNTPNYVGGALEAVSQAISMRETLAGRSCRNVDCSRP